MEIVQSISIQNLVNQRDGAIAAFREAQKAISRVNEILAGAAISLGSVADIFRDRYHRGTPPDITSTDAVTHFTKSVDSNAWQKLMLESGMRSFMDATARKEWDEGIQKQEVAELTVDNIRSTFSTLHAGRGDMFERGVISLFRSLSWNYKTNCPAMFNKKLILEFMWDKLGLLNYRTTDRLDDLMRIMHVMDGKPEPDARTGMHTHVAHAKQTGETEYENEYIHIKWFMKAGTAHVKFKRLDIVVEMNKILAKHHPNAIASDIRPAETMRKTYSVKDQVRPRSVGQEIANILSRRSIKQLGEMGYGVVLPLMVGDEYDRVDAIMQALGGKWQGRLVRAHVFDYDPTSVIEEVIRTRSYLDPKDFGFFPTPQGLATHVAELAAIEPGMRVLEPSAGRGALANACLLYTDERHIDTVEYLPANVAYLKGLGFNCVEGDFLEMAPKEDYDRVVMNPPYASQQDILHVEAAWNFLKPGGRLVAIMAAGVTFNGNATATRFRDFLQSHGARTIKVEAGAFKESGTNVSTVIVIIDKPCRLL